MIRLYRDFVQNYLALPVIIGQKTEQEKFAGAITTLTIEAMMKDGKALQSATSHYLGQNFSQIYKIDFKDQTNNWHHVFQTSWGLSTRIIGALIMAHGDNRGIIIPPKVAPYQIYLIEILANKNPEIKLVSQQIFAKLNKFGFRCRIDQSSKSAGFKAAQSEIEGVPLRIEIGPRDLEQNQVLFVRRDTLDKELVKLDQIEQQALATLKAIQANLLQQAQKRLEANLVYTNDYETFKTYIKEQKFVLVPLVDDVR